MQVGFAVRHGSTWQVDLRRADILMVRHGVDLYDPVSWNAFIELDIGALEIVLIYYLLHARAAVSTNGLGRSSKHGGNASIR